SSLPLLHAREVPRGESPTHVDTAAYNAGIAAWSIDQHAIKWRERFDFDRKLTVRPAVMQDVHNCCIQTRQVSLRCFQSLWVAIARHDHSEIFHKLRDVTRLSAGRCARIEDLFSGLWTQKLARDYGTWVLNVAVASTESACRQYVKFHKVRISGQWPGA